MKRNGNVTNWTNGHWEVNWNASRQHYAVYYKGLLFAVKYRFANVKCYLK